MLKQTFRSFILLVLSAGTVIAQTSKGILAGGVRDTTGAAISAASVAGGEEQANIKKALENLPAKRQCSTSGYAWIQESSGYRCKCGKHHITWEEYHALPEKRVRIADEKMQEKIKEALTRLPAERHCQGGYAWKQVHGGYQCKVGLHHITWEELYAEKHYHKGIIEKAHHGLSSLAHMVFQPHGHIY